MKERQSINIVVKLIWSRHDMSGVDLNCVLHGFRSIGLL